ncbi:hypothetical protein COCNU_scaffold013660G000010 [Cocos nucifera]|nr:hypothetical protein [Cocos nucifera]
MVKVMVVSSSVSINLTQEIRCLKLQTSYFSLKQIQAATNNFDLANKIGEGGFGPVYKGVVRDGSVIAVKQLSPKSKQGNHEFLNEIAMISAVQHPNLVKLYGPKEHWLKLNWQTRHKICLGVARGLTYLHEESRLKIVHRDIKATNILLDKDLNAKISDFGLARLDEEENTHINTRIAGTVGYMAPEYATRGYLTDKADVYSFGVVILEIVSGMSNTSFRPKEDFICLLDWVYLDNLFHRRVSDWKGGDGKFPPLQNMKRMQYLVLRNLSISGELPDFIGEMTHLYILDLSFNNLTGSIPKSFDGLQNSIGFMFLTNNMLSGTIPSWILGKIFHITLLQDFPHQSIVNKGMCPYHVNFSFNDYKVFINCGGRKVTIDDNEYEDDASLQALNMTEPELYMNARLNPLSLKYYGLCLQKGSYTVNLHFAEIMYTDDQTYFSVGERLFDVSIQGKKVLQDFNIAKAANGTEIRCLKLQTSYFSLKQIQAATNNFDLANKIGEGGFGPVYKGVVRDGSVIAVKQLSPKSKQGNHEFLNEIAMISAVQHPNLVKLYGPKEHWLKLNWQTRHKICLGVARGLTYLHEESRLKIVHRDIKATNILLDKDLNAKISDFGLARLDEEENTHINTRIAGTVGYMAPEYATRGYLTDKADVYSFGVVILEIVSGMSNTSFRPKEDFICLLDWAYVLQEEGRLLELVDPSLGSNYSKEEALQMLNLAIICTNLSPTLRPSMSTVVSMLDGKIPVQVPTTKSRDSNSMDLRIRPFEEISHESQAHSILTGDQWFDTSISGQSSKEEITPLSQSSKLPSDHSL